MFGQTSLSAYLGHHQLPHLILLIHCPFIFPLLSLIHSSFFTVMYHSRVMHQDWHFLLPSPTFCVLFTVPCFQTFKMGVLYFPFSSLYILVSKRQWMGNLQSLQQVINILPGRRTWKQHVSVDWSNFIYYYFAAARSRRNVSITPGTVETTSWWKLFQLSCCMFFSTCCRLGCKEQKCSQM